MAVLKGPANVFHFYRPSCALIPGVPENEAEVEVFIPGCPGGGGETFEKRLSKKTFQFLPIEIIRFFFPSWFNLQRSLDSGFEGWKSAVSEGLGRRQPPSQDVLAMSQPPKPLLF